MGDGEVVIGEWIERALWRASGLGDEHGNLLDGDELVIGVLDRVVEVGRDGVILTGNAGVWHGHGRGPSERQQWASQRIHVCNIFF